MTTFLETDEKMLDLYLTEPISTNIFDFYSTSSPDIINNLLEKYGRFWISNDGYIKYRQRNGNDVVVNNITVGPLGSRSIVRVNGVVVPTPALEQLKILLRFCEKCNFNIYSKLLENINNHRTNIKLN